MNRNSISSIVKQKVSTTYNIESSFITEDTKLSQIPNNSEQKLKELVDSLCKEFDINSNIEYRLYTVGEVIDKVWEWFRGTRGN